MHPSPVPKDKLIEEAEGGDCRPINRAHYQIGQNSRSYTILTYELSLIMLVKWTIYNIPYPIEYPDRPRSHFIRINDVLLNNYHTHTQKGGGVYGTSDAPSSAQHFLFAYY